MWHFKPGCSSNDKIVNKSSCSYFFFQLTLKLRGHTLAVNYCVIIKNDAQLITASLDKTLKLWDIETGELLFNFTEHTGSVNGCCFTHCEEFMISASFDCTIKIWNFRTRTLITSIDNNSCNRTWKLFFKSPPPQKKKRGTIFFVFRNFYCCRV